MLPRLLDSSAAMPLGLVGDSDGTRVGDSDGDSEGEFEGAVDGLVEGDVVGDTDGAKLGASVLSQHHRNAPVTGEGQHGPAAKPASRQRGWLPQSWSAVGLNVGAMDGLADGRLDGLALGPADGSSDGEDDGSAVRLFVGNCVV